MYYVMKRIMDVIGAIIGLVIASPVLVITAGLIKMENRKAPILFKQQRVGKGGEPFDIYKFRTMVQNAEDMKDGLIDQNEFHGPHFKIKQDPRVTKIGKFLRKTSIDEFPQFINVLKGDMSIVGPRPPLPSEVARYTEVQKNRLRGTPGCTGLWQVSGRNDVSFEQMVQMDIDYLNKQSVWLDVKIILKTFFILCTSKGAY